jgi:fumarate reductase subunit C
MLYTGQLPSGGTAAYRSAILRWNCCISVSYLEVELLHTGQLSWSGTAAHRSATLRWTCCIPICYFEMELLHTGQLSWGGTAAYRSAILKWNCCIPVRYFEMELLHAGQLSWGGTTAYRSAILRWNCCIPVSYLKVELLTTVTNKSDLQTRLFVCLIFRSLFVNKHSFVAGSKYRLPECFQLIPYQLSCYFVCQQLMMAKLLNCIKFNTLFATKDILRKKTFH